MELFYHLLTFLPRACILKNMKEKGVWEKGEERYQETRERLALDVTNTILSFMEADMIKKLTHNPNRLFQGLQSLFYHASSDRIIGIDPMASKKEKDHQRRVFLVNVFQEKLSKLWNSDPDYKNPYFTIEKQIREKCIRIKTRYSCSMDEISGLVGKHFGIVTQNARELA